MTRASASLLALATVALASPVRAQDPAGEAAPAGPTPAAPAAIDVTIEGEREGDDGRTFGRREIREMPGVLGDPLRVVEISPGVTPIASGIPFFFIRGAPPGNLGTFYEGVSIPLLFHVGAGPGVLPAPLVSQVELHLGPYPASMGRVAGGVIEATATEPVPDRWRGEGAFRIIDVGGFVEGPVADGATLLVGGRGSVGTAILSALVPQVDLGYADYQTRLAIDVSPRRRVTVLAFGSYDYLASPELDGLDEVLMDSDFHRLDVRVDHRDPDGTHGRLGATVGLDRSRGQSVKSADDWKTAFRGSVAKPVDGALLRTGFDLAIDVVDTEFDPLPCELRLCAPGEAEAYRQSSAGQLELAFRELFPDRVDAALGGWADAVIDLGGGSTVTPGLRADYYTSLGESDLGVDPRVVGRFAVGHGIDLVPAIGMASQPPGFPPVPGLVVGGLPGELQRSVQTSFGAEADLGPFDARATVFRHITFEMNDPIGGDRGGTFNEDRFLRRNTGDAYGLELSAIGPLRRDMFAYVSYTLSRATRLRDSSGLVGVTPRTLPSAYDRTHVAHAALLYDLGRGWRAGLRYVFYTGFPADELNPYRERSDTPDRTRPFFRMDARLSKRWQLGETTWAGIVFDMQNATLARETFDVQCDLERCRDRTIGPISIPTLALEAGF